MAATNNFLDFLLGKRLSSRDVEENKVGVIGGIPLLGLDALGSAAYGPEAALTVLIPLGIAGLRYIGPITLVILVLLTILALSYRQTITAYPSGGGGYTVARENLGANVGLLAAAALMLDYLLNVAVGIAAGVGALISAAPKLHAYQLDLCLVILVVITLLNLRGVRESGAAFAPPTYLFIVALLGVIAVGVVRAVIQHGHPVPIIAPAAPPAAAAGAGIASVWLLLRSFASGCTAMTGVEAISNGIPAFAAPATTRAKQTLGAIVVILGLMLAGIAYLSRAYHIVAADPSSPSYQSILSQITAAIVGRGAGVLYHDGVRPCGVEHLGEYELRRVPAPMPTRG